MQFFIWPKIIDCPSETFLIQFFLFIFNIDLRFTAVQLQRIQYLDKSAQVFSRFLYFCAFHFIVSSLENFVENRDSICCSIWFNDRSLKFASTSTMSFWCLHCWLFADFTHYSTLPIVDFEQINNGWIIPAVEP